MCCSNEMDEDFVAEIVAVWDRAEAILKELVQPSMPSDDAGAAAADAAETGARPRAPEFRPSPSCLLSGDLVQRLLAQLLSSSQVGRACLWLCCYAHVNGACCCRAAMKLSS